MRNRKDAGDLPSSDWLYRALSKRWCAWALLAVSFLACAVPAFYGTLNHDVGCGISETQNLLDGARLYVDIVDVNPPLFIYLTALAVYASRLLHTPMIYTHNAYVIVLVGLSVLLSWRVLRVSPWAAKGLAPTLILIALMVILLPVAGQELGQREHEFIILVMPYLLLSIARVDSCNVSLPLALIVGLLGGVGVALKPFFLLFYVAIEGYLVFMRHGAPWRRAESLALVGVHVVYYASVLLVTPRYLDVVRLAQRFYGAYDGTISTILMGWLTPRSAVVVVAALIVLVLRPTPSTLHARRLLLLTLLSAIAMVIVQKKGFSYHYYPAQAVAMLLLAVVAASLLEEGSSANAPFRPGASLAAAGAMVLMMMVALVRGQSVYQSLGREPFAGARYLRQLVKDQSVAAFSSSIGAIFPLVNEANARWGLRYSCLWVLPGLYRDAPKGPDGTIYHAPADMPPLEREFIQNIVEDLRVRQPAVVIVDFCPTKQAFGDVTFDFLEYFQRDGQFREVWKDYSPVERPTTDAFRPFLRRRHIPPDLGGPR